MQNILVDLGNSNTKLYIKDKLILEEKTNNKDNITYKDIKNLIKRGNRRPFNSKIVLAVLNENGIKLPRKIKVCSKQELILLGSRMDINKASATTIIYLDDNLIDISIYALGKMIFSKTINKNKKKTIKKLIESLDEEILSDIKEKGVILTGNNNIDDLYKELRKDLNVPIFKVDNKINTYYSEII